MGKTFHFMIALCLCSPLATTADSADTALQLLAAKLESLASLQAVFEQKQIAADGFELRTTNGELQVERPGRMRWVTRPPYEQWIISNGQHLWIYDPDLEQVTIRNFDADIANSPVMLLTGEVAGVANSHRITVDEKGYNFVLTPLGQNAPYDRITLRFDGNNPAYIAMTDSLGEKTAITFSNVTVNPSLDSSLFNFVPPDGVDIVHNE